MRTVHLIKLKDYRGIQFPELNILAQNSQDAKRAYLEYLHLDYNWYYHNPNDWQYEQELDVHCYYDIEG